MIENRQTEDAAIQVPAIYANGFQLNLTNTDISIVAMTNGEPQLWMNVSYTSAKSLHLALGDVIAHLENATGRSIMTRDEITSGLEKASETDSDT